MKNKGKSYLIKSKLIPDLYCQILWGKASSMGENMNTDNNALFIDNEVWMYELYKLLVKAEELGGFDHLKKDTADDPNDESEYDAVIIV